MEKQPTILVVAGYKIRAEELGETLRARVPVNSCLEITPSQFYQVLTERSCDLIVAEFGLPHLPASDIICHTQTPVLLVAEKANLTDGIDMMRLGARGFVDRADPDRLIELVCQELATDPGESLSDVSRYRSIIEYQTELLCRYNADCSLTFVSPAYCNWLGKAPEELLGTNFLERIPPEERDRAVAHVKALSPTNPVAVSIHHSLQADGSYRWYEWTDRIILDANGNFLEYQGSGRDITERKRYEILQSRLSEVLEAVAEDVPLPAILERLVLTIEEYQAGVTASVLLLDRTTNQLRHGAAPHLPDTYNAIVNGIAIGTAVGSCGTAAYEKRLVIVEDIQQDPLWANYRQLGIEFNLKACWSQPIFNKEGEVLGTFAMYYNQTRRPVQAEIELIQMAAHIAGIAIRRKQEMESLRESENRQRAILSAFPDLMFRFKQDGTFVDYHAVDPTLLALPPEHFLGKAPQEIFPPAIANLVNSNIQKTLASQRIVQMEYQMEMPSGIHDYEARMVPAGEAEVLALVRDVTERKKTETALEESEIRYRQMFELHQLPMMMVDPYSGNILDINPAAVLFYGYSSDQLKAMQLQELNRIPPSETLRLLEEAVDGKILSHIFMQQLADGSTREVEIFPGPLYLEGRELLHIILIDISEQKRMETALRESESRFQQFMEYMPGTVYIFDDSNHLQYCNSEYARSLGTDIASILGKPLEEYIESDLMELIKQENREVLASNRVLEINYTGPDKRSWLIEKFPIPNNPPLIGAISLEVTREKQAEEALHKAYESLEQRVNERTTELAQVKNRLEAIFDNSGDGILLLDLNEGIQQANYTFETMFGCQRGDYIGKALASFVHPDNVVELVTLIYSIPAYHAARRIETRARRQDGSYFDVEISLAPVNRSAKEITSLVCIIQDITERKQAQQAIAEEKNLLRTVIDTVPDFIYFKDLEHRMVLNNIAHARSLGAKSTDEVLGKVDLELFPSDIAAKFLADEVQIFETGQPILNTEERSIGEDGSIIWALTTKMPFRNLKGEIAGIVGITRDITAIKANELALITSEERYRTTISAMSEGIILQNKNGVIELCNTAAEQMLGMTADQIMGRSSHDPRWQSIHEDGSPFPGKDHPSMVTLQTGEPQSNVVMGVHKPDGSLTWLLINARPLIDPAQELPYAVVTTFTDITKRKVTEEILEQKHQDELQLQNYLKELHEITVQLARCETLDSFYQQAVEFGVTHFGYDRMGLLLYDKHSNLVSGTYGTDSAGKVVKEDDIRLKPSDLTGIFQKTLDRNERLAFDEVAELYANFKPIGKGNNAVAALWNGEVLGWLAIDNGITHKPFSKMQLDILALYALAVGSLLARKHTETALRESEGRYRLLAENVMDLITRNTLDGKTIYITPSVKALTGFSPEEVTGRPSYDFYHPDDIAIVKNAVKAIIKKTTTSTYSYRVRCKDGRYIWLETTSRFVKNMLKGQPSEIISVSRDISERKNAEENLQAVSQRLEMAAEAGHIGIWELDFQTNNLIWDDRMFDIYGLNREEFEPDFESWKNLLHPDDQPSLQLELETTAEPINRFDIEFRTIWPDSTVHYINSSGLLIRKSDGMPLRMVGINLDITDRKEVEETLRSLLEKEKELGELKTRFVSMASHEFRTPLAAILATSEALAYHRDKMTQPQVNARLDKIRQQVLHMKDIIDDVLQLERIQAGKIEFNPILADLEALVREVVEEFASQDKYHGRLQYLTNEAPLMFNFDQRLMRQIISNLLSNALKYSPDEQTVQVLLRLEGPEVILQIKDRGIGIGPEDMKRLFEPFHRASNAINIPGTGLGLSITKQSIELHGGQIFPESQLGVGTIFTVILPLS